MFFEKTIPLKKNIDLGGHAEATLRADFNLSDITNKDFSRLEVLGKLRIEQLLFNNKSDSLHVEMSMLDFIPSIAVRILTSEVIPMAIIAAVNMVLVRFDFIDFVPSLIFSAKFIFLNLYKIKI